MKSKRSLLFKLGALLILVGICVVMFIIGRGHTVFFDNKKIEYEGVEYTTPYKVVVTVNGEQAGKLYDKERGKAIWIGQNFKMTLNVTEEKGGDEYSCSVSLKLPYNMDGVIINIPALLNGLPKEAYMSEYVAAQTEETEVEEIVTDEFALGDF